MLVAAVDILSRGPSPAPPLLLKPYGDGLLLRGGDGGRYELKLGTGWLTTAALDDEELLLLRCSRRRDCGSLVMVLLLVLSPR